MDGDRPKKDDVHYIQRDLEAIKHTLDKILRPYKADVRNLRQENESLRRSIAAKEAEVDRLMRFIASHCSGLLDAALAVLVDPKRPGWKRFRSNWRQRLGLQ